MLRMVDSSRPGEVDEFRARCALEERLILTRALIATVRETAGTMAGLRVHVAVDMLRRWEASEQSTTAVAGKDLQIPKGYEDAFAECEAGLGVAESLEWAWTADTQGEKARDLAIVAEKLEEYRVVAERRTGHGPLT